AEAADEDRVDDVVAAHDEHRHDRLAGETEEREYKIWGTYSWYWQHISQTEARAAGSFRYGSYSEPAPLGTHMNNNGTYVPPESKKIVMADTETRWNWWLPQSTYMHYNGLFLDKHVELITSDDWEFSVWLWGPTGWRQW
ncbi:hypothetical protein LCGC14_1965440, partial [marine sediment metagenome]